MVKQAIRWALRLRDTHANAVCERNVNIDVKLIKSLAARIGAATVQR